jgi:glycosyltransferase involved in cell wall biosynthesis
MRIVIDATPLLLTSAGVKTYLYYWIEALQARLGSEGVRVFPFLSSIAGQLDHRRPPKTIANTLRLAYTHFCNIRHNPALDLWPWNADVFHASPHVANPPVRRLRLTATIYDMTCWLLPQTHDANNVIATKRHADRVLKRAEACIAISHSARHDAMGLLGIAAERITTIYPGVSEAFYEIGDHSNVNAAYRLEKPYLLYVGTIEPRKNVDTLLDAYEALPSNIRNTYDLVLAGLLGWASHQTKKRLDSKRPRGVRYLGYVPEQDVPALTRGATGLVFPSLYEGFGFPVAQSMAAGVPVITSQGSSLEEIAKGAALLVNPLCVEHLRHAMHTLVESTSLQQQLTIEGRRRAESFRWTNISKQTEAFFHNVVNR